MSREHFTVFFFFQIDSLLEEIGIGNVALPCCKEESFPANVDTNSPSASISVCNIPSPPTPILELRDCVAIVPQALPLFRGTVHF